MRAELLRRLAPLSLVALLAGCSTGAGDPSALPEEVFVLGVSALEWSRIDALVEQGELPHFRRLLDEGVRAEPRGFDPLANAALWVSIQTGRTPRTHGILGNLETLEGGLNAPARSASRRSKTLWQMVSDNGQKVVVAGMPATWPVEVVRGAVVGNTALPTRWTETRESDMEIEPGVLDVFPETLAPLVQAQVHPPDAIRREELTRFFVLNEADFERAYDRPLGSILRGENPLRDFVITHQADRSFLDIALTLRREIRPRVTACLLELPSVVQSVWWVHVEPELYPGMQQEARRFGKAVDEVYRWVDEELGRVLESLGPRAGVVVVSDHGFGSSWQPDGAGGRRAVPEAQPHGVLLLHGPGVRRGAALAQASVLDLTPTLLAWLGLPVGRDLPGRPLTGAFTEAFARAHPPIYRSSYEAGWDQAARYPVKITPEAEAAAP